MTTGAITYELLQTLPKTDLHCHLDGSLRLDTVLDLARKQNLQLPTFDRGELHRKLVAGDQVASLDDYLRAFDVTLSVMQVEGALERCAYELAEDAWRENVRYLEVRYSPLLHTRQGLRPAQVVEAVLRGLRMAKRELGIRYGVILCAIRSLGPESSLRIAELCIAFKNRGVVGFDLAGSEVNNPAKLHRQAFQLVVDNNINCTAHAGEACRRVDPSCCEEIGKAAFPRSPPSFDPGRRPDQIIGGRLRKSISTNVSTQLTRLLQSRTESSPNRIAS